MAPFQSDCILCLIRAKLSLNRDKALLEECKCAQSGKVWRNHAIQVSLPRRFYCSEVRFSLFMYALNCTRMYCWATYGAAAEMVGVAITTILAVACVCCLLICIIFVVLAVVLAYNTDHIGCCLCRLCSRWCWATTTYGAQTSQTAAAAACNCSVIDIQNELNNSPWSCNFPGDLPASTKWCTFHVSRGVYCRKRATDVLRGLQLEYRLGRIHSWRLCNRLIMKKGVRVLVAITVTQT